MGEWGTGLFIAAAIMVLGFVLMAIEFTILPGFGVIGLLGVGVLGYGCWELAGIVGPELGVLAAFMSLVFTWFAARSFLRSRQAKAFVLEDEVAGTAVDTAEFDGVKGKQGRVVSPLRPSGIVELEGRRFDAVARDGVFLEAGVEVEVVGHEHGQVRVVRAPDDAESPHE